MKKAELRKIMKRAWLIKKENTANIFSLCLKMAWAEAKAESERLSIKGWFQAKLESENNAALYNWGNSPIKETEKAILLSVTFQTGYGKEFTRNCWIPRTCLGKAEKKFISVEKAKKLGIPLLKRA